MLIKTVAHWKLVFYIVGALFAICAIIFTALWYFDDGYFIPGIFSPFMLIFAVEWWVTAYRMKEK